MIPRQKFGRTKHQSTRVIFGARFIEEPVDYMASDGDSEVRERKAERTISVVADKKIVNARAHD